MSHNHEVDAVSALW